MKKKSEYWTSIKHIIPFSLMVLSTLAFLVTLVIGVIDAINRLKEYGEGAEPNYTIATVGVVLLVISIVAVVYFVLDLVLYKIENKQKLDSEVNELNPAPIVGDMPSFDIKPINENRVNKRMANRAFFALTSIQIILDILIALFGIIIVIVNVLNKDPNYQTLSIVGIVAGALLTVLIVVYRLSIYSRFMKQLNTANVGYKIYQLHIDEYVIEDGKEKLLARVYFLGCYSVKEDEDMFSLYLYIKNQRCVMVIPKSLLDEDMMSFLRKTLR